MKKKKRRKTNKFMRIGGNLVLTAGGVYLLSQALKAMKE
jgi:hypothetical protein